MAASGLHISISAERLFNLGEMGFTNSMLTSVVVSGLLIAFALWVRVSLRKTNRPTGVQNFAEWIVESLTNLVQSVTNSHRKTEEFFPFVASFFLIILVNNWFGLLPGVGTIGYRKMVVEKEEHASVFQYLPKVSTVFAVTPSAESHEGTEPIKAENVAPAAQNDAAAHAESTEPKLVEEFVPFFRAGTADLNTTLALGIFSMALVQYFGFKHLHLSYLGKFFNFSSPINAFVGFLELISDFSKIISFAFRLFGNVFAGEVLLAVITSLTKVIAPMPFYGLELFVGFIQALVFAMLSVVLFNMATQGHGEEH